MTKSQKDVKLHCDLKSSWEEGREKDEGRKEGLEGSWADTTEKAAPHLAMNAKAHGEPARLPLRCAPTEPGLSARPNVHLSPHNELGESRTERRI